MKTIRFGILGAGNIAKTFCDAVHKVDGAETVAVASQTEGKAQAFAEENNVGVYYNSYEDMLSDENVDVVYVATTHNFHYENMLLCIKHKKAIICEKPFVLTEEEALAVFEAAKEAGVFIMEAMWSRFLPAIQKVKAWIENGEIGDIELAHAMIGFKASEDPKGRILNPDLAGGAIYDIGVYDIEIMTYLINQEIQEVQAMNTYATTGVDKVNSINLKFEHCIANLQTTVSAYCASETRIYGTEGYIVIPNMHYASECRLYKGYDEVEHFIKSQPNGFVYQVEEVVRCMQAGKLESDIMPYSDTIACARLFDICLSRK